MKRKSMTNGELHAPSKKKKKKKMNAVRIYLLGVISGLLIANIIAGIYFR